MDTSIKIKYFLLGVAIAAPVAFISAPLAVLVRESGSKAYFLDGKPTDAIMATMAAMDKRHVVLQCDEARIYLTRWGSVMLGPRGYNPSDWTKVVH